MLIVSETHAWYIGFSLGLVVVAVAAAIVLVILSLAHRISKQAEQAREGVDTVREQTVALSGIAQLNDSGVRILHAARALRKVAVGR